MLYLHAVCLAYFLCWHYYMMSDCNTVDIEIRLTSQYVFTLLRVLNNSLNYSTYNNVLCTEHCLLQHVSAATLS